MALNCDPNELALAAKCFQCLDDKSQKAIELYLMALIAGVTPDPEALQSAAKAFKGIGKGQWQAMMAYVLCQASSGNSPSGCCVNVGTYGDVIFSHGVPQGYHVYAYTDGSGPVEGFYDLGEWKCASFDGFCDNLDCFASVADLDIWNNGTPSPATPLSGPYAQIITVPIAGVLTFSLSLYSAEGVLLNTWSVTPCNRVDIDFSGYGMVLTPWQFIYPGGR